MNFEFLENSDLFDKLGITKNKEEPEKKTYKKLDNHNDEFDKDYDGYYDDRIPDDSDVVKNKQLETGTIKKIAIISVVTLVLIIISVVIMTKG